MGLFLLVLFVGGSLALALRAWTSYDKELYRFPEADSDDAAFKKETPLLVALMFVTFVGSFLSEFLRHSLRFSFVASFLISSCVVVLGQWLALRIFGKQRIET